MKPSVTTALDVLGLLLIAAGVAWTIWPRVGPFALVFAGAIIMVASAVSTALRSRPGRNEEAKQ